MWFLDFQLYVAFSLCEEMKISVVVFFIYRSLIVHNCNHLSKGFYVFFMMPNAVWTSMQREMWTESRRDEFFMGFHEELNSALGFFT